MTVTKATADREANRCLARPDRRITLSQVLTAVGRNRSERPARRAQCYADRTVIKNKLHRSLPFLTTARQVNRADRKPARAPSQKREPSIKKLQIAKYSQEQSTQAQQAKMLSKQLTEPESFATTAVTPQVPPTSARSQLARQGAVKRGGIDLLVMPPKLNGRLPARWLRSVDPLRGLVKPRNLLSRGIRRGPTSRGTRQRSAGQPEPRRRPYCRHRSWRSGHRARGSSRRAPPGRQA